MTNFAPRRGAPLFAAVLDVVLAGIPVAAQESEVHKDVPYVQTPLDTVEATLKLGNVGACDIH